jgi:hypothetical protein
VAVPTITAPPTTTAPSPSDSPRNVLDVGPDFGPLEPGAYDVQPENIPVRVVFTVPAEGWTAWIGAAKPEQTPGREYRLVGMSIVNVTNLVVDGCTDHRAADPPVGPTVNDLAEALASLQPFVVTKPPSDVTIYGYHGQYLELAVPEIRSEPGGAHSRPACSRLHREPTQELDRTSLSFAYWGTTNQANTRSSDPRRRRQPAGDRCRVAPDSPSEDLAQLRAVLDSIVIQR